MSHCQTSGGGGIYQHIYPKYEAIYSHLCATLFVAIIHSGIDWTVAFVYKVQGARNVSVSPKPEIIVWFQSHSSIYNSPGELFWRYRS